MRNAIRGIHHVTAISGPAQQNVDFYVGVLGMRLVKRTVNFDDPRTYHLYYGDDEGRPGTIMTSFPWENAVPGRAGKGMVTATAFSVPPGGVEAWMEYLADRAIDFDAPVERFGRRALPLRDPDGLRIELVEDLPPADGGDVRQVGAISGVVLCLEAPQRTARLLRDEMGFVEVGEEAGRIRFEATGDAPGRVVDLYCTEAEGLGRMSSGVVHHVAFRVRTEEEQDEWRSHLLELGYNVSEVRDRQYFKSIYFREPNGVLFEIATDSPGFQADEMPDRLGTTLRLPPWLEPRRTVIEQHLTPLNLPS